jgi:hypothetical protein
MTTEKLSEQLLGLADEWQMESCTFDASAGEINILTWPEYFHKIILH